MRHLATNPPAPAARHPAAARIPDAPTRYRTTRAAHRDETAQDYVEAIEELEVRHGSARVGALARHMGVSHVTASRIVSRLCREDLVDRPALRTLALTAKGKRLAARIRERHETVVAFLLWLGVPAAQAEIDAEGIEHHVSEATIRAIRRATGSARDAQAARKSLR